MLKVIIAEDERVVRKNLTEYINDNIEGFTVVASFADGKEAVEYLQRQQVDVVITDVKMHEVSGLDVAKYVYENGLKTAVIIISAYRNFQYAQQSIQYFVCDYLSKPVMPIALRNALQKAKKILSGEVFKAENTQNTVRVQRDLKDREATLMEDALDYIQNNFNKDISLGDVARHVYLSEHYFGGIFKKNKPEGFSNYLLAIRMKEALRLLETKRYTINEISNMVGYKNSAYFIKIFKNYTGKTPKQYFRLLSHQEDSKK